MYGLLVGFGLMFDKGRKQSSTLSCDSSYLMMRFKCQNFIMMKPNKLHSHCAYLSSALHIRETRTPSFGDFSGCIV